MAQTALRGTIEKHRIPLANEAQKKLKADSTLVEATSQFMRKPAQCLFH